MGPTTYAYTVNGDLNTITNGSSVTTLAYDSLGRLLSVAMPYGNNITYTIDALGNRTGKSLNGVQKKAWLYSSPIRIAAELDGSMNLVSRFVYGTHSNVPDYMINGGVEYRIITDQIGSVRFVVNSQTGAIVQQLTYDSFGNVLSDTNPGFQPFGFGGGLMTRDWIREVWS